MKHTDKYREVIIAGYLLIALLIVLVVVSCFVMKSLVNPENYYPSEGLWVCEESGVYLNAKPGEMSYIKSNGEKTLCIASCASGSKTVYVYLAICPEMYEGKLLYMRGELLFEYEVVDVTDNRMILEDRESMKKYVFVKTATS